MEIQTPDLFSPDAMAWPLIPPVGDLSGRVGGWVDLRCVLGWIKKSTWVGGFLSNKMGTFVYIVEHVLSLSEVCGV